MPLDPELVPLLDLIATVPPMHAGSPEAARAAYRRLTVEGRAPEPVVPVAAVEQATVPGPGGDLPVRVYRPEAAGPVPTIVLFHGGGWVIGDLDTHDAMARTLCRDCSAVVVSVDYRLAPDAPFPAAVEDALAATRYVLAHVDRLGGDPRVGVAGDSAGANLAAVVAQHLRDEGGAPLAGQLLIYPATDVTGDHGSRLENGEGYFLDLATMAWFLGHYAADPACHEDPRLSPLRHPDLAGLPPAVVVTAEYDPLRDEGQAYAEALAGAGVPTDVRCFDGLIHGFFDMGTFSRRAQAAIEETSAMFAKVLNG